MYIKLGSSRPKAANSSPSFTMMSTIDDDDKDLSTSDELSRPSASLQTFSEMISKECHSFKSGMSFVHTNYLDTWGEVWKTGKYSIPLAVFFFLGVAVYPGTTMNVVSEQIRSMLERVLMLFHSTPVRLILATLRLPNMIVRGIINGSLRSLSDVTAIIGRISHWVVSTPKASSLSYGTLNFSLVLYHAIVIAPIMEELVFRWGLWRLWKLFLSKGGDKEQSSNESDSDDSRSLSHWVIVSSFLFAAAHITNHLPVPSADEVTLSFPRKEILKILSSELDKPTRESLISSMFVFYEYTLRYLPIIFAMFQCQVTYVMGSSLLCPLFLKHGFWAALGAHFAWNVCVGTLPFQIPLRLLIRMIRNAKERREMKKVHDD